MGQPRNVFTRLFEPPSLPTQKTEFERVALLKPSELRIPTSESNRTCSAAFSKAPILLFRGAAGVGPGPRGLLGAPGRGGLGAGAGAAGGAVVGLGGRWFGELGWVWGVWWVRVGGGDGLGVDTRVKDWNLQLLAKPAVHILV